MTKAILTFLERKSIEIPDEFTLEFSETEHKGIYVLRWSEKEQNNEQAQVTLRNLRDKLQRAKQLNFVPIETHYSISMKDSIINIQIRGDRKTLMIALFNEILTQAKLVLNDTEIENIVNSIEVVQLE